MFWIRNTLLLCAAFLLAINALGSHGQEDEAVTDDVDEYDPSLYQGDLLLTEEQQAYLEATANPNDPYSPGHAAVIDRRFTWPDAVVPYVLDASLTQKAINAIHEAIAEYNRSTCVRFVPRTSQHQVDYVVFTKGHGCYSYVGRVGGSQDISIGSGCTSKGIVMHEMFHALGRWHEHSRPDRDEHVEICTDNILPGTERNFQRVNPLFVTTNSIPYDLDSIMHYGAHAFSSNRRPTIKPLNASVPLDRLGQRRGFSEKDLMHVNAIYCEEEPTGTWTEWSSWSSCTRSCNGGTRTRTRTCSGGFTCEGKNIDIEQCNTNPPCPDPSTWGPWSSWSGCSTTCGRGRQSRLRRCLSGNSCVGKNTEFRDCNRGNCPEPTWSPWSSWSTCSKTCRGGTRNRIRTCLHGNNCPGISLIVGLCNLGVLCDPPSFEHVGCYRVPQRGLESLEGHDDGLTGDPMRRRKPIQKCGKAALRLGHSVFALNMRYCLSGPSDISQSTQYPANGCKNGVGGFRRGAYLMDVYEIPEIELPVQNPALEGFQSVGCYSVPMRTLTIESLESMSDYLNSVPIKQTNAILMCAMAASELSYTVFGVSMGYCISGSNNTLDYRRVPAQGCRNGIGGYSGDRLLINVYYLSSGDHDSNTIPSDNHIARKRDVIEVKAITDEVVGTSPGFVAEKRASGEYVSCGVPLFPCVSLIVLMLLSLALPL